MSPLHRRSALSGSARTKCARGALGFTLVELLMAMTITAMLSVVLGGLVLAVQTAREHTEGLEEATAQGQACLERVRYMVSQAGVYQLDGSETVLGLRVVGHEWSSSLLPDILVVWSGGRDGGLADSGTLTRLPHVDELVLYTYDAADPSRFVEIVIPGDSSDIDFAAADFDDSVLALLGAPSAEALVLCNRLRRSVLTGSPPFSNPGVGNVAFRLELTPDDASLAGATPGTSGWNGLTWSQGVVSSDSGMRQANVRIEIQIEPRGHEQADPSATPIAVPFFGSASYRYVYRP